MITNSKMLKEGINNTKTMDSYILRKAVLSDAPMLSKLRIDFIKFNNKIPDSSKDIQLDMKIKDFIVTSLNDNSIEILVIEIEEKIIGTCFISFYTLPPKFSNMNGKNAYITNIYILEEYRRLGLARNLMNRAIIEAKVRNCGIITLHTTNIGKPLYKSLKFEDKNTEMILHKKFF